MRRLQKPDGLCRRPEHPVKKHTGAVHMESDTQTAALSAAEEFRNRVLLKAAKIIKVEKHPGGTMLYILTLDAGDPDPRQIVSSIVPFYTEEELLGKTIVLVSNLKPANFRGVRSNGMLLAASDPAAAGHETCEVLFAPQFAPGTVLEPEGLTPPEEQLCYVKPDKFFSMPLYTKDGFVETDGKKIGAAGSWLTAHVYVNGSVG
jgi:methionine--tRNA ligase beta chain